MITRSQLETIAKCEERRLSIVVNSKTPKLEVVHFEIPAIRNILAMTGMLEFSIRETSVSSDLYCGQIKIATMFIRMSAKGALKKALAQL